MEILKTKPKRIVLLFFLLLSTVWNILPVFAQEFEEEGPLTLYKWYYCPRAYPFDTIPAGAFEKAVVQREALRQSTGYQFPAPARWEQIGPKPFGYDIGSSGRIHHVIYDPRDGNSIYVTGACGGLWKTEDGGVTWVNKSGNLPTLSAGAFAISYVNNNKILYFGSGDGTLFFGDGRGMRIFKSTDDGATWTSISSGLKPGTAINKIAISPNDPTGNTIFAATFHGLYKTTNGGGLWTKIIPRDGYPREYLVCSDVCFSPDGSRVYAVGPSAGNTPPWDFFDGIGYWRSDDGGDSFDPASGFPHPGNILCGRTLCAVSKASGAEDLVWFITFHDSVVNYYNYAPVEVYKSTNHGQVFTSSHLGSNEHTFYQLVFRVSDVNANICFAGSECLYKTINGGANWTHLGGYYCSPYWTLNHPDFLAVDFNPFDPAKITVGSDAGVFRSNDLGSSWTSCNQNLGSLTLLQGLASSTYDANFVAGGLHDYGYGYNPTAGPSSTYWYDIVFGSDGGNMTASPFKSKHFIGNKLMGCQPILYSTNGTSFSDAIGYDSTITSVEHAPFTHHPTEPGVVYTARFNSWFNPQQVQFRKSTDYGVFWGGHASPWRQFQRPSGWDATAPYFIAISQSNPNTIIMNFSNQNEFWLVAYNAKSRLIKSTNGGLNWFNEQIPGHGIEAIVEGGDGHGIPNRSFTDVEFDPKDANIVYLTVSGYYPPSVPNEGHVFKSTDGGYNWSNISGKLPDIPVSDLIIHYNGSGINDKELIVATDAGIYVSKAIDIEWRELAADFPNTYAIHLDYNRLSGKLRANTWGRGAWEFQLDGTIYVQDHLYITDNVTLTKPIVVAPGGKLILGHSAVNSSMTVTFNNNANIIVMDGGEIDASSGVAITLTSSGTWGGIEFQGSGYGALYYVTFQNTETSVSINPCDGSPPPILIKNCSISGAININSRANVTIAYCNWNTCNNSAITSSNSNNLYIYQNSITCSGLRDCAGIAVSYGQTITIWNNTVKNFNPCISVSNTSAVVYQNTIINEYPGNSFTGVSLDYGYSSVINENTITGYQTGIRLFNSSPTMYKNSIDAPEVSSPIAMNLNFNSYPRLRPTFQEGTIYWDAGQNSLFDEPSPTNQSSAFYLDDLSLPDVNYGYNTVRAVAYYLICVTVGEPTVWYAECNYWYESPPEPKFIGNFYPIWDLYNCEIPGGGGDKSNLNVSNTFEMAEPAEPMFDPPEPIIVNYGNGLYDTIKVSSSSVSIPLDRQIYFNGVKNELLANYATATTYYQQVIQNYQDSATAIYSMKRILNCKDKLGVDSTAYSLLRTYYQQLAQNNATDTSFSNVAEELAIKCLVRMKQYPGAITEYENVISNTTDSLKILGSELNIIETYMIMINNPGGNMVTFTGKLTSLKPQSIQDGFRMIREKTLGKIKMTSENVIPKVFSLAQNYPNPFNPYTYINYSLPKSVKVTIKVYDILGRLVKELVNEYKEAGYYTTKFDGTNFASGVYFYRIEAGSFVDTKKMVLVK